MIDRAVIGRRRGSAVGRVVLAPLLVVVVSWAGGAVPAGATGRPVPSIPAGPVGAQLAWFLGAVGSAPLSTPVIDAHFDSRFLATVDPQQLNAVLDGLSASGAPTLVSVAPDPFTSSLVAVADFGGTPLEVQMAVDGSGLIEGLELTPASTSETWAQVDSRLASLAPGVGLLAARLGRDGTCVPIHEVHASTPRPTASMFKLFVLGALAEQIAAGRVRWDQELTVEPSLQSRGSIAGSLQYSPAGTRVTVREAATKMISISDNTAADMLIHLVGRSAVEAQVRRWSAHAALDDPFLTTREVILLHYSDFPSLARRYLSLSPAGRQAFLTSTVDPLPLAGVVGSSQPRDIASIEWFASPDDLCRAFAGLQSLASRPGLGPIAGVLSVNHGDSGLEAPQWQSVWFKGGSEPGVLTLGYRARTAQGQSYVVVAMAEDPDEAIPESTTLRLAAVVNAAFGLAHR